MTTTAIADNPRYFALDLANDFIADMYPHTDDDHRESVQDLLLCAGQHLADCGTPGAWDSFCPETFLSKLPVRDQAEMSLQCIRLVGLYGWLGTSERLDRKVAATMVRRIRGAAPDDPDLAHLCSCILAWE